MINKELVTMYPSHKAARSPRSQFSLKPNIRKSVMMFKIFHVFMIACLTSERLCAGESGARDLRANLVPGAGGYGTGNMDGNYDYILDDTPPRGKTNFLTYRIIHDIC